MISHDSAVSYFLVEWYQPQLTTLSAEAAARHLSRSSTAAGDDNTRLVAVLTVLHDSTLFGVFAAPDADAVIGTCQRAGWPAARISADVQLWLAPTATNHDCLPGHAGQT